MTSGLSAILERHRAELSRFVVARCGDATLAEDLMQDLWIRAASQATGPVDNPRAYLFRMASNLVLDHRRSRQRSMRRDHDWLADGDGLAAPEERRDPALPADEALSRQQEAEQVRKAIAALPAGARRALRLCRFEGRKLDEAARILGISRSGVEKGLALAMRRLRAELLDCGLFAPAASDRQEAPDREAAAPMEDER